LVFAVCLSDAFLDLEGMRITLPSAGGCLPTKLWMAEIIGASCQWQIMAVVSMIEVQTGHGSLAPAPAAQDVPTNTFTTLLVLDSTA
jgi:hypothetical protein